MQRNLRVRAGVNRAMREAMAAQDFVEIETPMLIASTPEGARDFVVPSRLRPGDVLRAAAESAAVQAAADGRRLRSLLPDRALPARRGPARRSAVRVHAARHRDDVRRPGGRARRGVGRGARRGGGRAPGGGARVDPADDVARGDGALRLRQARRAVRHGARRAHRRVRRHRVPRVRGRRRDQGHSCPGPGRHVALEARRVDRTGEVAGRGRASCGCACATAACWSRRSRSSSPKPNSSRSSTRWARSPATWS